MSEKKTFIAASLEDAITEATASLGVTSDKIKYEIIDKGSTGFLGLGKRQAMIEAWTEDETVKEEKPVNKTEKKPEPVKENDIKKGYSEANKKAEETKRIIEERKALKAENEKKKNQASSKKEQPKKEAVKTEETPVNEQKNEEIKKNSETEKIKTTENDKAHFEDGKNFLKDIFEKMGMEVKTEYSYNEEENTLEISLEGPEMGVLIGKRGQTLDSIQYLTSLVVNRSGEHYIRVKIDTENYREKRKAALERVAKNMADKVRKSRKPISLEPMNPYERRIIHSALQSDNFVMTKSEGEEPYRHVVIFYKRNKNGEER